MIDGGVIVMHPALAYTLTVHSITPRGDELRVSRPQPFMAAAAQATGVDRLTVIDTGLDPLTSPRGQWDGAQRDGSQWDDGGNALSLGRGLAVCDERNLETNARLTAAGVEVIPVARERAGQRARRPALHVVRGDPGPGRRAGPARRVGDAARPGHPTRPGAVPAFRARGEQPARPGSAGSAQQLVQAQ